ncbi:MAG: response regulator [Planctomycetes bacterium]|nr:response regulator [Planctomycetota bacterium]
MNVATQKHIVVNDHLDSGLPEAILGDEARLRQILFNLVGNAVKFTAQGEVNVRAYRGGGETGTDRFELCFEVSDTGIGIPKDKLGLIFETFTQIDSSRSRDYGGVGLGLAIVKELCSLTGGDIQVESEESRGSRFTILLPLRICHESKLIPQQPSATEEYPRVLPLQLNVLFGDDDKDNQEILVFFLESMGCQIDIADDGNEALLKLNDKPFDIIFMDCQMPILDGYQTTQEIRRMESKSRHTVVIGITAFSMRGDREKCLNAGMDDYISKPYEKKVVLDTILKYCS